jgi:rod shape determining protein RodA
MISAGQRRIVRWGDRRGSHLFVRGLHLDIPLLVGLVTLAMLGLVILYSASGQDADLLLRQGVRLAIAFTVMFVLAQIPPHYIEYWAPWLFGAGLLLLAAVLLFGEMGKGAQRWLDLGLFRFQPSELMKLAVPVMIAWYLSENPLPPNKQQLAIGTLIILVPVLLIAKQPDLGTAILIAGAGVFVLLLAGMRWRYLVGSALGAADSAPLFW